MNFCITVFGCKSYEDVARKFVDEFTIYNKDLLNKTIFFSDDFIENLRITQKIINENVSWSMRVAKSLETINEEYIYFLLDDYFIQEEMNITHIDMIINYSSEFNLKYCRLINTPADRSFGNMRPIKVMDYAINLQPSLWNRIFLISILKKIDSNPWVTETSLHKYFKCVENKYIGAFGYNFIDYYLNAVIKGRWSRNVSNKITENSNRIMMSRIEWVYYKMVVMASKVLTSKFKKIIKYILKKVGFIFYS